MKVRRVPLTVCHSMLVSLILLGPFGFKYLQTKLSIYCSRLFVYAN